MTKRKYTNEEKIEFYTKKIDALRAQKDEGQLATALISLMSEILVVLREIRDESRRAG